MRYFFSFYLIFLFFSSSAQEPGFKLYTTKDGLVGNQVGNLRQDSKGFLWLATTDGVSRFDGLKFKNFTKNNGLSSSLITDIDFSGDTTFIRGRNGIDIIVKDSISKYYEVNKVRLDNKFLHINGRLYIFGEKIIDNKVVMLDVSKRIYSNDFDKILNTGNNIKLTVIATCTYKLIKNKIYRLSKNNNLENPFIDNTPEYDNLACYFITNDGDAYIVTKDSKKNKDAPYKLVILDSMGVLKRNIDLSALDSLSNISRILPITKDIIVLLDFKGYINVLKNDKISKIAFNFYTCNNIIKDNVGNIWVATDRGLVKVFYKGFQNFPASSGYPEYVWGVFPENKSKIWFSCYTSGIKSYENGKITKTINKINGKGFFSYYGASKGFNNDFIIPSNNGIIVFNFSTNSFKLLDKDIDDACLFTARDTIDQKIVFGKMTDFFAINKDYSFELICSVKNFGSSKMILAATRRDKNYYLACSADILEFNITTKKGKWFNLKNVRFNSIATDYKNNLWAASDEGICFFSKKDTLRFMKNENFMALVIDKMNCLFAVNEKGLYRLDLASFYKNGKTDFEFYGEDEGFSGAGDQNAFFRDDEGNLWIPGGENSIEIIPSQLGLPKLTLQPLFDKINVSNNANSTLSLLRSKTHTVDYSYKNIQFDFLAVCLISPEKVRYQYRLLGYDSSWSQPNDKREASFTNLAPGDYTFEVRASCYHDFDNAKIAQFKFTITPPFWQTWWFYSVSLIIIAAIIIFIFRWQLKRVKKQALLKQKMSRLEMDLLHTQIEPHFVGNSLEVIKNFIRNNKTDNALKAIDDFGGLLRSVALTTRKNSIPLSQELQIVDQYIRFQKLRYGDIIAFDVTVNSALDMDEIMVPPLIIQPFIENSIKHGLRNKDENGMVRINIKQVNADYINIAIFDNGIGMKNRMKIDTGIKSQSIGITNSEERLRIFNEQQEGVIEIVERADGSEVILWIKIRK